MFRAADDDKWPRGLACGRYVYNVLIVDHGLAQIRTSANTSNPSILGRPR
jgi:hypothetical protein